MDEGLRVNIKKTATRLFLKYGLRSVSIDDICNELHISKKTFYAYFSQKEALIESVLLEHNEKYIKRQALFGKTCPFKGNAIDDILGMIAFHKSNKNKQFVYFFFDLHKYYPDIHKKMLQLNHKKSCEKIKTNIMKGIDEGLYRTNFNIDLMSRMLALQFLNMLNLATKDLNKSIIRQSMEMLLDINIRILCNQKGLEYYEKLIVDKQLDKLIEDEPLKDEELDAIIDTYINETEEMVQTVNPLSRED